MAPPPSQSLPSRSPHALWIGATAAVASVAAALGTTAFRGGFGGALAAGAIAAGAAVAGAWGVLRRAGRTQDALADGERRYRALAEASAVGIWHISPEGDTIYLNPTMAEMLEVSGIEELRDLSAQLLFSAETLATMRKERGRTERGGASAYEAQLVGRRGRHRTVLVSGAPILDADGRLTSLIGSFIDISDRKRAEELLAHRALHDPLTELPNRDLFMDRLTQALARARRRGRGLAVLFFDLDRFKQVNDSLGHAAGDRMLAELARRLSAAVRQIDTVARFGGDEFAVLLDEVAGEEEAIEVASRIADEARKPVEIAGKRLRLAVSIGIAFDPGGHATGEDLLRFADTAMYTAKRSGTGLHIYDPTSDRRDARSLEIESDLWQAVDNDELLVHYQPIADLAQGRLAGFEALVRWCHPEHGLLHPDEFIPLAEQTGAIVPIGRWALREAARRQVDWAARYPDLPVPWISVNLSDKQFRLTDLPAEAAAILGEFAVDPRGVRFEITETLLMQAPAAVERLKQLGTHIALDDFGTGYSSLGTLNRVALDGLKLDRSFLEPLGPKPEEATLVGAVIRLAKALDLEVTAEGVETAEQMALLRQLGCHLAQGSYFATPLSMEAAESLLASGPRW